MILTKPSPRAAAAEVTELMTSSEYKTRNKKSFGTPLSNLGLAYLVSGDLLTAKTHYTTSLLRLSDSTSTFVVEWISVLCLIQLIMGDGLMAIKYWKQLAKDVSSHSDPSCMFLMRVYETFVYLRCGFGSVTSAQKGLLQFISHSEARDLPNHMEQSIADCLNHCIEGHLNDIPECIEKLENFGLQHPILLVSEVMCYWTVLSHVRNAESSKSAGGSMYKEQVSLLDMIRSKLEHRRKLVKFMDPAILRMKGYHALASNELDSAQKLFIEARLLAERLGYKYDEMAAKFELKRKFNHQIPSSDFSVATNTYSRKKEERFDYGEIFTNRQTIF